jgi:hypothetical protein
MLERNTICPPLPLSVDCRRKEMWNLLLIQKLCADSYRRSSAGLCCSTKFNETQSIFGSTVEMNGIVSKSDRRCFYYCVELRARFERWFETAGGNHELL